ncbi:HAD family hydrolase [Dongia rigui]|uniref:HAD family phosphatase n=1 Tax=Dongia rigui TaxID=940149 RepID=A0ABU5DUG1_9PROT|nr:HAD family phosphatase [Dongia rigui]MDY0870589.1 HAD family phosphatase [Dongia rigui]
MKAALLFDLDGTLVDTDHLHLDAFNRLFAEHGFQVDRPTYTAKIMGQPNAGIAETFLPHLGRDAALALLSRKEEAYRGMVRDLTPIAGLIDLLDWVKAEGIPCGVVTNAPRANAELVLEGLGLAHRFETLVIGDELAQAKPHPLPYLTGLERLGADARKSVAFEDSPSGMQAALGAGLTLVGLATSLPPETMQGHGAHVAVKDYHDPRIRDLIAQRLAA